jgi:hypothetical protein
MPGLLPNVDPDGLLEYSVVYTDRALNHMSQAFQGVMRDVSATLKRAYGADAVAVVPGGGTFAMEAVARQFAGGRNCLVLRNGWFSFRWSQILDMGGFASATTVLKARRNRRRRAGALRARRRSTRWWRRSAASARPWSSRRTSKPLPACCCPTTTCAPSAPPRARSMPCSCSTASRPARSGSTCATIGVDVLISAPQKGWSGPSCAGFVMARRARPRAHRRKHQQQFRLRPEEVAARSWKPTRPAATPTTPPCPPMPCAACVTRCATPKASAWNWRATRQLELGRRVRAMLVGPRLSQRRRGRLRGARRGGQLHHRSRHPVGAEVRRAGFADRRRRAAAVRRGADFSSFRIGLFGLDKLGGCRTHGCGAGGCAEADGVRGHSSPYCQRRLPPSFRRSRHTRDSASRRTRPEFSSRPVSSP